MPSPLLQMRIRQELLDAVDAAAKGSGMDRKTWVVQTLEAALGSEAVSVGPDSQDDVPRRETAGPPASPRAPVASLGRVEPRRPDGLALARMRKLGL